MTYVIAEPCIGTKDTACVDVCPVDCIHPRKDEPSFEAETQLYINPAECIDCGACVPVCPVTAISGPPFFCQTTPGNGGGSSLRRYRPEPAKVGEGSLKEIRRSEMPAVRYNCRRLTPRSSPSAGL